MPNSRVFSQSHWTIANPSYKEKKAYILFKEYFCVTYVHLTQPQQLNLFTTELTYEIDGSIW